MPNILQRTLSLLTGDDYQVNTDWLKMPTNRHVKSMTERELLRRESEIGATLFGPIAMGGRREFFLLDDATWIWYEEWTDVNRVRRSATTRYEVQDNGILKIQEGARYSYVTGQEYDNICSAISIYYERVAREVYRIDPDNGTPLNAQAI